MRKFVTAFGVLLLLVHCPSAFGQNAALVVIDMQTHFVNRLKVQTLADNAHKLDQALNNQTRLIALAKKKRIPIILVQYENRGATLKRITKAIGNYSNVIRVTKKTEGLFSSEGAVEKVKAFLGERQVTELIVTGANGGSCVQQTIEEALENGYGVWTSADAIVDLNLHEFIYPYHYTPNDLVVGSPSELAQLQQREQIHDLEEIVNSPPRTIDYKLSFERETRERAESSRYHKVMNCYQEELKSALQAR